MIRDLVDRIKHTFLEALEIVAHLVADTVIIVVALGCFRVIDLSIDLMGFNRLEFLAKTIELIHPITILSLTIISLNHIFLVPKHMKKPQESKPRFELINERDSKLRNSNKSECDSNIKNESTISSNSCLVEHIINDEKKNKFLDNSLDEIAIKNENKASGFDNNFVEGTNIKDKSETNYFSNSLVEDVNIRIK